MNYDGFVKEFYFLSGIQLGLYKENQMKRRISTRIERKKIRGYQEYLEILRSDNSELAEFIDYITINVTEFFRTPEHWKQLEAEVLEKLTADTGRKLKIWCCACSTGEEAYSLAISLLKFTDRSRFHIYASDIDESVLQKAIQGAYSENCMFGLSDEQKHQYFEKEGSFWRAKNELKECISFERLNLLKDEYPTDCDLIVCRNVLIYFTEEAKNHIYTEFKRCLKVGGYLFTGKTEQIIYYKKRGFRKISTFLYENTNNQAMEVLR